VCQFVQLAHGAKDLARIGWGNEQRH
jgi:hypothetical protein